jgi:ketosteroid isomerase-like protein
MYKSISMALVGAAAISLTLGGCDKSSGGAGAANADTIKQAIKADEDKWNKDVKAKDTEALAGHYADDAYFVPPGAPAADGSTAIRQFYSRGHFAEKYTDKKTGKVMTDAGTYVAVYKKQDDGSWKIVQDFAAANPDSAKPVPPEKPATRAKMTSFG